MSTHEPDARVPWYRRTRRWGQTNITEIDAREYDLDFWRRYWRSTCVQGVIINAGGIIAYYPSRFELHTRATYLGDRDLFGEVAAAARQEGLVIVARMDANRAAEACYKAHPDWFSVDESGQPHRAADRHIPCINGPYYRTFIPDVLREVIDRYQPEGFTDNNWSGLGRSSICYCNNCVQRFHEDCGENLPRSVDWDDPLFRRWVLWGYERRTAIWELYNQVTREHGGADCLWIGMLNGDPIGQAGRFRDLRELAGRSAIIMCDHQGRDPLNGFEQNGLNGRMLHELMGWKNLIPESMAMYTRGPRTFRLSTNPPEEARTWMRAGFAGGISPWWHHISARHEDRRQYETAMPLMRWHQTHEAVLYDRLPVANVGLVWSQRNIDFFGRNEARERLALPWRGWTRAMMRGRIAFLPVHADDLDAASERFQLLILPHLAVMSEAHCRAVSRFVERGGSLIATGRIATMDERGDGRGAAALDELLGARLTGTQHGITGDASSWEEPAGHTYVRLLPALNEGSPPPRDLEVGQAGGGDAGMVKGRGSVGEVSAPSGLSEGGDASGGFGASGAFSASGGGGRHPMLRGFDRTDILPFGGLLEVVEPTGAAEALATFIPSFPIFPPEFAWMRTPRTDIPAILARVHPAGGRIIHMPADIDRCHGRCALPDHADLLANAIRWCVEDQLPFEVTGPGCLDCHLYRQADRLILHMVNLTGAEAWPQYVEAIPPVGPFRVSVALPPDVHPAGATALVNSTPLSSTIRGNRLWFELSGIAEHEVVVIE